MIYFSRSGIYVSESDGMPRPIHHQRRPRKPKKLLRWILLAAVLAAVAMLRGQNYEPMTYKAWEDSVQALDIIATKDPDQKQRDLAAMVSTLAKEGYRLGFYDGLIKGSTK